MNVKRLGIHSLLLSAAACFCISPVRGADLPEGEGKEVIQQECTSCHTADRIAGQKKSKSDWQDTVERMMGKGAGLSSKEYDVLIAYLVKNFSKEDPAKIGTERGARSGQ